MSDDWTKLDYAIALCVLAFVLLPALVVLAPLDVTRRALEAVRMPDAQ